MGLDLVDLVYRIEDEFEITIPDEAAGLMTTPQMVIDYVSSRPEVKWPRDHVEATVWLAIVDELGISKEDFNNDSRFIEDMGAG